MGNPEDPGDASIAVNPTCVRVPVFYGHAEAVHVELHQPLDAEQVKELLRRWGVTLFDDEHDYPTRCAAPPAGRGCWSDGCARIFLLRYQYGSWPITFVRARRPTAMQIAELLVRDYL